ncbi:carcinoembryonic antigen-related cell adhesion molecule 21-like isoform X2 [Anguilla rostrata]|uniref:carcinoembryonic antigen-related cell adhesion molecule 21-like isoform X2 n=1 Tax=Anguilla rostrata TaxID=7938 RepID=UPI0030CF1AC7
MKIILCIFLLNITVSVFGQSVELHDIVGQSVKFPADVKKDGFLMYGGVTLGDVTSGIFRASLNGNYRDRVQWDSSTGLFSLSGLKMEDIGDYKVQNTDQNNITVFQLNVYIPVSKPHVSITHNEFPCTLLCAVERGRGVTLSWYREGQKKPYVSSRVASAPHLHLPVPVESGTYTCEAKNSVSKETSDPLTVGAHCTDSRTWIIVASVIAAVAVLIAVVFAFMYHRFKRRRRAVKTFIEVKKILDNVDPQEYGKCSFSLYICRKTNPA